MTEAEWLACKCPEPTLGFVGRYTSRRKERLFALACFHRIDHLLDDRSRARIAKLEEGVEIPLPVAAAAN